MKEGKPFDLSDTLILQNPFNGAVVEGQTISVNIFPFLNPISAKQQDGFKVTVMDKFGGILS